MNTFTSMDQGTTESQFCVEWYEIMVRAELSLYKWRFATKQVNLLSSLLVDLPIGPWNNAYQIPNDVESIDTVLVQDNPIRYDRSQDQIHTNDTRDDDVILQYRFRADETVWNPYFELLIVYRLATMLSFSIARKVDVAGAMKGLADEHWKKAKTEDAQAQTNKKVRLQKLVRNRNGRLEKFWRSR